MQRVIKYNFKSSVLALFSGLFVLFFSSCEDTVKLDLNEGTPKIVIDAELIWKKGTTGSEQTIRISKTTSYYNADTPKVSGAQVRVENSNGTSFIFNESAPGVYVCTNFVPVVDMDYVLHVQAEGQSFTAVEKLTSVTPINKVEQKYVPDISGPDVLVVQIYFNDPADKSNYYLTDFKSDFLKFPLYVNSDDELLNGNEISIQFGDTDLKPGKTIGIVNRGISKNFFNYMKLILEASQGNPFSVPPGNIRGNIVNTKNADSYAMGYFRLCEADAVSYLVK
ncbi:DUF4249 domain-containing protein [Flavobacterium sp. Fl-318]|uniref:DUF4249 domain-containing protein n=1 Tax=Flavobacterium cupriresistens TaxID=2893885 RepID=A0ABU4RIA6_9FLAO|nr:MULTISPECIES: DUF4249 domain-containing protein [unclassified Flavobacterium]MDX6191688.1 DUF4249 domain-containing protein [Flavobacterium sp. Fl-318]UFH41632.1 DUF4249 domain-containing protein [Flavobacterium sp. F-323]